MKTVGEKNVPGQDVITDLKGVEDNYVLLPNEIFVNLNVVKGELQDERGYRFTDDNGNARELTDAERPAPRAGTLVSSFYFLNNGEFHAPENIHPSLDQIVFCLFGSLVVESLGVPGAIIAANQIGTIAKGTSHRVKATVDNTLFATWFKA